MTDQSARIASATAIVSAYLGRNQVIAADIPHLIKSVYDAVAGVGRVADVPEATSPREPAVPVRRSVTDGYIICLEDGAKLKMLKRYLRTHFDLTPTEYRARWKLLDSYPMVAPAYSRVRSDMAKKIGLGSRPGTPRGRTKRPT